VRSSRRLVVFLVVGLCLAVLIAWLGQRLTVSYRTPLTVCVVDSGTGGGLGLVRWAKRLGFPVRPLDVPLWEAAAALERPAGNCILTAGNGEWSPLGEALAPEDWQTVHGWLVRGNALIVVTTSPAKAPEPFRREVLEPVLQPTTDEQRATSAGASSVAPDPETDEIAAAGGGRLTVAAGGPRRRIAAIKSGAEQLAGDDRGGALFRFPVGEGAVFLLLDDFAWTNAGLDQGDNAGVLAGILGRTLQGGVFAVDEYRHGHGRPESFLTYLANLPGARAVALMAALWGLFFLYGRNLRPRPPEEFRPTERRTAREYIDAVAGLHERARAAPLVVEAVARRLRHLSRGAAEFPEAAAEVLRRAEGHAAAGGRPVRPTADIDLVVQLLQVRKQLYGSRTFP
jgi:hypothetical protein